MKTIKDLNQMIKEPASKEWFEKHSPKHDALVSLKGERPRNAEGKIILKKARRLTPEESKAKAKELFKNVPKRKEMTENEKISYQHRTGRAYSE